MLLWDTSISATRARALFDVLTQCYSTEEVQKVLRLAKVDLLEDILSKDVRFTERANVVVLRWYYEGYTEAKEYNTLLKAVLDNVSDFNCELFTEYGALCTKQNTFHSRILMRNLECGQASLERFLSDFRRGQMPSERRRRYCFSDVGHTAEEVITTSNTLARTNGEAL